MSNRPCEVRFIELTVSTDKVNKRGLYFFSHAPAKIALFYIGLDFTQKFGTHTTVNKSVSARPVQLANFYVLLH